MRRVLLLLLSCLLFTAPALAEGFIGSVQKITGKGYVVRAGARSSLAVGDHIFADDVLVTVKNSTMGVIFRDDSQVALGPESELFIDEFVFDPKNEDVGFLAKMSSGTAAFLSGKIAKLAPEKVQVQTPLTTIGIRGTKFIVKVDEKEAANE